MSCARRALQEGHTLRDWATDRQLGLRMALNAQRSDILRLILAGGGR